ncbi:MAG: riboflavin kinase, partial [Candidatus Gastranaerophilaceae bacterium]
GVIAVIETDKGNIYKGVMNYGLRPTVDKSDVIPVPEVHLLGFSGNLYGKIIKTSFIVKIREERPFKSLEELKAQIQKDSLFAQSYND